MDWQFFRLCDDRYLLQVVMVMQLPLVHTIVRVRGSENKSEKTDHVKKKSDDSLGCQEYIRAQRAKVK